MKSIHTPRYQILIAKHSGMCFGVRQALSTTETLLSEKPATILGQLAHNPSVTSRLSEQGAQNADLTSLSAPTPNVIITAHGAADRDRKRWKSAGYQITDTTCPLVKVAHRKLAQLVSRGYLPVIIGQEGHVEVRGLQGDFPNARVILHPHDIPKIPHVKRIGIISQTTQAIDHVRALIQEVRKQRPEVEVVFYDTVCQPTKDRQNSLIELCTAADLILAIGGKNSNNTAQLARTARKLGCKAHHITQASEIREEWLIGIKKIGLTAGTSTLDSSLHAVAQHLEGLAQRASKSTFPPSSNFAGSTSPPIYPSQDPCHRALQPTQKAATSRD